MSNRDKALEMYVNGVKQIEIASRLGISKQRVGQIIHSTLKPKTPKIFEMYNMGVDIKELQVIFNKSKVNIYRHLSYYNNSFNSKKVERRSKMFDEGLSVQDIAKLEGVNVRAIYAWKERCYITHKYSK